MERHLKTSGSKYGSVAQVFHWGILLLVGVQIYVAVLAFRSPDEAEAAALLARHRPLGIVILVLMLLRLFWRIGNPPPPLPATLNSAGKVAARATHWLLYALLVCIPLTGWIKAGAEGIPVSFFGMGALPALSGDNPALAETLRTVHLLLNTTLLVLVPVHIVAALWHQFWKHDGTLQRMLPGGR
jgi:cytochrome b561